MQPPSPATSSPSKAVSPATIAASATIESAAHPIPFRQSAAPAANSTPFPPRSIPARPSHLKHFPQFAAQANAQSAAIDRSAHSQAPALAGIANTDETPPAPPPANSHKTGNSFP